MSIEHYNIYDVIKLMIFNPRGSSSYNLNENQLNIEINL